MSHYTIQIGHNNDMFFATRSNEIIKIFYNKEKCIHFIQNQNIRLRYEE